MKKVVVVLGAPCSGKDTQAKMLAEKLNYKYCSSDDVIYDEIKNKTKIGLIIEKYSGSETKVPDEYLIMLIKEVIINLKEDGVIFNNFPKTINQAKTLDTFLFSRKIKRPIPILLETENMVILKRLAESSNDGGPDLFKNVMNSYESKIKPIVDYYDANGFKFDTSIKSAEIINENIIKTLTEKCLLI